LLPPYAHPGRLDGAQGGSLHFAQALDAATFVAIPAPGRALDAQRRQHSQIGFQPLELSPRQRALIGQGLLRTALAHAATVPVHSEITPGGYARLRYARHRHPLPRLADLVRARRDAV